jgi:carbon monoxide dehydrogenase subunit G
MVNVTDSIELTAPPEQVVEVISSLNRWPEWLTIHVGFGDGVPDEISAGTTFKQKVKILGMPGEVDWTVTEVDEPRRVAMEGKGPMGTEMRTTFRLEPTDGGGTQVHYDAEFGGAALTPLLKPLEKETKKASAESLEKLRAVVDAG